MSGMLRGVLTGGAIVSIVIALTARRLPAESPASSAAELTSSFDRVVKPFFQKNCIRCHNTDASIAGVRVDQLDPAMEDRTIATWEGVRRRVEAGTMPPKGMPQPPTAEREQVVAWISNAIEMARLRPAPKNGLVRRLTIAQYRNTLRELLDIEEDLTMGLPPDAVSKDGFVNNKETLQLPPLLTEAYFEIAEKALDLAMVDPAKKPVIQDFRVDLGRNVNPAPLAEKLILGAGSELLDNSDVLVTQPALTKPFVFEPFRMRTKYRYIEGYRGNDTVRGWRDFDSIYHAVFADLRGSHGYPKGKAYGTVPEGLLLRPAIPNDEQFGADGTYGPKANFKISVRELPDSGRFRVTVTASRYRDGLLLDPEDAPAKSGAPGAIIVRNLNVPQTVVVPKSGVYQVDLFPAVMPAVVPETTSLNQGLAALWPKDQAGEAKLTGKAKLVDSPVGKALSGEGGSDLLTVPRAALPMNDDLLVGEGDFAVAAWVRPRQMKPGSLVSLGNSNRTRGWFLEISNDRGTVSFRTAGSAEQATATVSSPQGILKADAWQHVAVVVRRGMNDTRMFVNGKLVARAATGSAQFDDERADLRIGGLSGEIADARLYRRPLEQSEILGLIEPGKQLAKPPADRPQEIVLTLGDRVFTGSLKKPAFLVLRLEAGETSFRMDASGVPELERAVLTPLDPASPTARKFLAFEKRSPRLGVHMGFRRDCGSTFAPVGPSQVVAGEKPAKFVFEGAIKNYPNPEVEKNNVNYLAGVREIAVRSEYADGRDMPRLVVRSVEFEGPYYDQWPPKSHRNIFIDSDPRRIITNFASKAYRRPVTPSEEAVLINVYSNAAASGRSFRESIKEALTVALTSPQFLFLIETSKTPQPEPLDSYELASKLSYFLWNGPPDARTLQLAAAGTLRKQLDAEVNRMLADPRFRRFTSDFVSQWLSLDKFAVLDADRKRFPKLTRDTRAELKKEPVEFVQYLFQHNLPAVNLVRSDFIVANEVVASYYGLGEKTESGFGFVPIQHGRPELGGILSQAAVMAGLSDGRESNPVKRGAWLARKIIAEPPADPPPNVPPLKEDTKGLTLRQRLEQHRNVPGCLQCHSKIDPWGVALEEFDAGGRFKTEHTDARSVLPDQTEVGGANDLKRYLSEDRLDQVAFSFLKHLATYACGRTLTYNELSNLKTDSLKLRAGGYRMQDMVRYVVNSSMFLEK